jgi:hypothetical protein
VKNGEIVKPSGPPKNGKCFIVCFPKGKTKLKHCLEANEAEETASKAAEDGVEETTDQDEDTGDNLVESLEQSRESDEERGEEGDEAACLMIC